MNQNSDVTMVTRSFVAHALLTGTISVRLHSEIITMLIVHVYVVAVQGSSVVMMIWVT